VDEIRARYLRDRVMTASPAQRIVMLYDRLGLDLRLAAATEDSAPQGEHISHAVKIVAELYGSLDVSQGGPAENLASIYTFLLKELMEARSSRTGERLAACEQIVTELRTAWFTAAEQLSAEDIAPVAAGAGSRGFLG
jgi:flagellar protein FliS